MVKTSPREPVTSLGAWPAGHTARLGSRLLPPASTAWATHSLIFPGILWL